MGVDQKDEKISNVPRNNLEAGVQFSEDGIKGLPIMRWLTLDRHPVQVKRRGGADLTDTSFMTR